ncbi:MAG: GIY-YIG nuclease family protein [Cocleimonas sp.]
MLLCSDNSLYTGITTDLVRRVEEHNSKKSISKYTRARQPVKLVYEEKAESRSIASQREYQLKKLSRKQKEALIS